MSKQKKNSHYLQKMPIKQEVLDYAMTIAENGAKGLADLVDKKDGKFVYSYRATTGKRQKGYNVLRHCGTCWSMLDVYHLGDSKNEKVLNSAKAGLEHLLREYRVPAKDSKHHCVITPWYDQMSLGANGLAILALVKGYHLTEDKTLLKEAKSLAHYIIEQEMPDGDFYHYRTYSTNEHLSEKRCEYYPGECLFGLMELYHATGDEQWLKAVEGNSFHVGSEYGISIRSHWMLYTLESLDRASPNDRYFMQAELTAKQILGYLNRGKCFRGDRCCSIATQTEGLLAYLRMCLRRDDAPNTPIFHEVVDAVKRSLCYQYTQQQYDGNFLLGGTTIPTVRIDSTQHNISGFLHYALLAESLDAITDKA